MDIPEGIAEDCAAYYNNDKHATRIQYAYFTDILLTSGIYGYTETIQIQLES